MRMETRIVQDWRRNNRHSAVYDDRPAQPPPPGTPADIWSYGCLLAEVLTGYGGVPSLLEGELMPLVEAALADMGEAGARHLGARGGEPTGTGVMALPDDALICSTAVSPRGAAATTGLAEPTRPPGSNYLSI